MKWNDEIDAEIRRQAVRLYPKCVALFELKNHVKGGVPHEME